MIVAVTLEKAKEHLRIEIDCSDDDTYITSLVDASLIYIDSMAGEAYKTDAKAMKLADLLQLKLISDMYENRGTEVPQNTKQDRIAMSILDKLSNYEEV